MLEMRFVRENPKRVKKNISRRNKPEYVKMLEELLEKDEEWRDLKSQLDTLRHKRNELTEKIKKLKAQNKSAEKQLSKAKSLSEKISSLEKTVKALKKRIVFLRKRIPNLLDDSVPVGEDESDNVEVRRWGEQKKPSFSLKYHGELAEERDLVDFSKGVKVSGAGFYYLKNKLALLDFALQRFAVDELMEKGFSLILPPFMMRRKPYEGVVDLEDFENVMYKADSEDLYLIATSEHPIAAMKMNEILEEEELPLKFCGISPCFRKEIGRHSIDERGLFRVHQFNKVEQFVFCKPENSSKMLEELLENSESLVKKLGLPYRVVNVCTGDIGTVASKKYDIEVWSPREEKFFEIVSCSNCGSYQATRLKIRYRKGREKEYVHTLNATAIATTRTIRAILENFQQRDYRVSVPKPLQKYLNGVKRI